MVVRGQTSESSEVAYSHSLPLSLSIHLHSSSSVVKSVWQRVIVVYWTGQSNAFFFRERLLVLLKARLKQNNTIDNQWLNHCINILIRQTAIVWKCLNPTVIIPKHTPHQYMNVDANRCARQNYVRLQFGTHYAQFSLSGQGNHAEYDLHILL